jgi:hypothetical protein
LQSPFPFVPNSHTVVGGAAGVVVVVLLVGTLLVVVVLNGVVVVVADGAEVDVVVPTTSSRVKDSPSTLTFALVRLPVKVSAPTQTIAISASSNAYSTRPAPWSSR